VLELVGDGARHRDVELDCLVEEFLPAAALELLGMPQQLVGSLDSFATSETTGSCCTDLTRHDDSLSKSTG